MKAVPSDAVADDGAEVTAFRRVMGLRFAHHERSLRVSATLIDWLG